MHQQLSHQFHPLMEAVGEALTRTPRASSLVENLNSRLRNYFFLRKTLGDSYLSLLQFFINHRRFIRSQVPERVGKSPVELMTGSTHPHWLELLGFKLFQRAYSKPKYRAWSSLMMACFFMQMLPKMDRF